MVNFGTNSASNVSVKTYSLYLLPLFVVCVGVLSAVALFDAAPVSASSYHALQSGFFVQMNESLSAWPRFWENITELGDALVFFPLLSFLMIRNTQIWAALFGAVPLAGFLSSAGKNLASVPRPAAVLEHDQFNILGKALTAHNSLPSGHTITAFAIITVLVGSMIALSNSHVQRVLIFVIGFSIATLIGVSRVAVGAHWPLDVLVGASMGILAGGSGIYLAHRYSAWWAWMDTRKGRIIFGIILLLWSASLIEKSLSGGASGLVIPWVAAACSLAVGLYLLFTSRSAPSSS